MLKDSAKEYDKGCYHYSTGNLLTWTLHGDLEGTYVMSITYIWPLSNPAAYKFEGHATFKGTILGVKTSWTARVRGSGLMDYSDPENHPFKGEESWTSTLTSSGTPLSHMRGSIVIRGAFDYGVSPDQYTYTGSVMWQTGKKN